MTTPSGKGKLMTEMSTPPQGASGSGMADPGPPAGETRERLTKLIGDADAASQLMTDIRYLARQMLADGERGTGGVFPVRPRVDPAALERQHARVLRVQEEARRRGRPSLADVEDLINVVTELVGVIRGFSGPAGTGTPPPDPEFFQVTVRVPGQDTPVLLTGAHWDQITGEGWRLGGFLPDRGTAGEGELYSAEELELTYPDGFRETVTLRYPVCPGTRRGDGRGPHVKVRISGSPQWPGLRR